MIHKNYNVELKEYTTQRITDVYTVTDNFYLDRLVLSQVILHPNSGTIGHSHSDVDEIYFFQFGEGKMLIAEELIIVCAGDIVQVSNNKFHKVFNTGLCDMVFHTVYNKVEK